MNRFRTHLMAGCALGALIAVSAPAAAQTWVGGTAITTPASQAGNFDWDNNANWNPAAAPNSAGATANFGNTGGTNVVFSAPSTTVGTINFAANAQAYTFTLVTDPTFNPNGQTISLGGITNNSGTTQTFNINPATASGSSDTDSLRPFIGASAARNFETDDGTRLTPELREAEERLRGQAAGKH